MVFSDFDVGQEMKIHWHLCKDHPERCKITNFESHVSLNSTDIAPQNLKILQRFVWKTCKQCTSPITDYTVVNRYVMWGDLAFGIWDLRGPKVWSILHHTLRKVGISVLIISCRGGSDAGIFVLIALTGTVTQNLILRTSRHMPSRQRLTTL